MHARAAADSDSLHPERNQTHPPAPGEGVGREASGQPGLHLGGIHRPVEEGEILPTLSHQGARRPEFLRLGERLHGSTLGAGVSQPRVPPR